MQQSRNWRGRLASGRISAACVTLALAGVAPAHAETIVGLTNTQQLVVFNSASPNIAGPLIGITGLATNETLLGMDYRPSTGVLYGLGSANRLYTLNPLTGAATFVAALTDSTGAAPFSLAGGAYGVDFNPVPDIVALPSLRVTSTSGENLRINVNPGSAGRVSVDTPLSGPQGTPLIAGSAYTNPDRDPTTGTALFGIDFGTDSVYQQIPPNNGTLSLVGALGVDTTGLVGYDISITGTAYVSLTSPLTGKSSLYTSGPGGASLIGAFGIGGNTAIAPSLIDIAVTPVPEPGEYALMLAGLALVAVAARRRKQGDD